MFSREVAAAIELLVEYKVMDKKALTTAWFLDFIRKWHDLMSSRHPKTALSEFDKDKYKQARNFLERSIRIFHDLSIRDGAWKPIQTGAILSTSVVLELSEILLAAGHKFVMTSRFLTDAVENVFSCVRAKDPVPKAIQFKYNLRMICASQFLLKKNSSSYEDDESSFMISTLEVPSQETSTIEELENQDTLQLSLPLSEMESLDGLELAAFHFLCGYTIKTLGKLCTTCDACFKTLEMDKSTDSGAEQLPDLLTFKRDFTGDALTYPSRLAFDTLMVCEKIVRNLQRNGQIYTGSIQLKKELVDKFIEETESFKYLNCHGIKKKLVSRFAVVRLRILGKLLNKKFVQRVGSNDGSLGSRSMAMRKHVDKLRLNGAKK